MYTLTTTSNQCDSKSVAAVATTLANTMGLFLQKTNIIRDFLEDYVDGRFEHPMYSSYHGLH